MKKLTSIAVILSLFLAVSACNDSRRGKNFNEKTQVDDDGLRLLQQGVEGGNAEIKFSELALKKSQNPEIKSFAQMMITDHTQVGADLKKLAGDKYTNLPDNLSTAHSATYQSLSAKSGADFDKSYIQVMVEDHQKAVELFERASNNSDQTINHFADEKLPKLRQHLKEANDLCSKLK